MTRPFWFQVFRISGQKLGRRKSARRTLQLETLEPRDVPSTGYAVPTFVLLPQGGSATPFNSSGPTGTTPTQIKAAYGFNQISFNGVTGDGRGETIAIVDAYDDPTIASDLQQFDAKFNLPNPTFTKVNQSGGSTMPTANSGWSDEISLDVEWAHAIAPGANILLVEANDSSYTNLFAAVKYAAAYTGVVAVSMSWGGSEFSGENSYDSTFQTPAGHQGVTFVASSGDSGAPTSYPSASPNVLSVGGTTLNLNSSGAILSETGWSDSGGGISTIESQPSYQKGVVSQSTTFRTDPDVSYDADPNTGFPVYDSYANGTTDPWAQFGGTSDAAPQWAALIAIADQGRAAAGLGSLDGPSQTLPKIYSVSSADFHDITSGTSTGSPHESAGTGYDLVTGRGSPVANLLVADLVGQSQGNPGATHFSVTTSTSTTVAGTALSVTVTALGASGTTISSYLGSVHFTSTDTSAVLPSDYTFTASDNGSHTFTLLLTLKTAGSQTVTATDKATSSITGSASVTVTPAAASKLLFGQQPTNAVVSTVINPAVTVDVLDAFGNLVTTDNSDKVTLAFGSNPGSATLGGTVTATVSGGVATFSNLTVNQVGTGYTLTASSGSLTGTTSSSFNVTASSGTTLIEGFEGSSMWNVVGGRLTGSLSTAAAHDGTYGLVMANGTDWIYRSDSAAQVNAGDTVSAWVQLSGSADGRAYFGFGASSAGTLSLVIAPNTGQLILQSNAGYGYTDLADVNQTYQANHWYRLEVDWGKSGTIIGKLFDSNGTTLLQTVTAKTTSITSGGIAFRGLGSNKYFDTITDTAGVNNFAVQAPSSGTSLQSQHGSLAGELAAWMALQSNPAGSSQLPWYATPIAVQVQGAHVSYGAGVLPELGFGR